MNEVLGYYGTSKASKLFMLSLCNYDVGHPMMPKPFPCDMGGKSWRMLCEHTRHSETGTNELGQLLAAYFYVVIRPEPFSNDMFDYLEHRHNQTWNVGRCYCGAGKTYATHRASFSPKGLNPTWKHRDPGCGDGAGPRAKIVLLDIDRLEQVPNVIFICTRYPIDWAFSMENHKKPEHEKANGESSQGRDRIRKQIILNRAHCVGINSWNSEQACNAFTRSISDPRRGAKHLS